MKTVEITSDIIKKATEKAKKMGELKNSITKGKGNVAAFVGEFIVHKEYGGELIDGNYDYDLILPDGRRADVKTKRTTVIPKKYYECSVAALNTEQDCDVYIFTRVDLKNKIGYILGCITKEQYFKSARFLKKGMVDPDNDYIVKEDCYNVSICELSNVESKKIKNNVMYILFE